MAELAHTQPRDPRFYREPQKAVAVAAKPAAQVLRCARGPCGSVHTVTGLPPERVAQFARDHGWHDFGGDLYCSKTCAEIAKFSPDTQKAAIAARAAQKTPAPNTQITHVVTRDWSDRDGAKHRVIACARWECQTSFPVDPALDAARVAKHAESAGFVQTAHGATCSADCARRLLSAVAAGRQDPTQLTPSIVQESTENAAPVSALPAASRPLVDPAENAERKRMRALAATDDADEKRAINMLADAEIARIRANPPPSAQVEIPGDPPRSVGTPEHPIMTQKSQRRGPRRG